MVALIAGIPCILPIVGLTQIVFGPRLDASPGALAVAWIVTTVLIGLTVQKAFAYRYRAFIRLLGLAGLHGALNGALIMAVLFFDAGWRDGIVVAAFLAAVVGAVLGVVVGALLHAPLSALRRVADRPTRSDGLSVAVVVSASLASCFGLSLPFVSVLPAVPVVLGASTLVASAATFLRYRATRALGRGARPGYERVDAESVRVPDTTLPLHPGVHPHARYVLVCTEEPAAGPFREASTQRVHAWVN